MPSLQRQRGLGLFGLVFVLAVIAFLAIVGVKTVPMYLNQMKVASAMSKIAADPENANADPLTIRKDLQKYWDIDDVEYLSVNDVKIKRTDRGRFISYDYEARERLFYNIYIVIHFADDVPLANVQS
ncbi:DUF4845 domain-containing protein [Solimonas soli]|uniref:DUF4845 domain-containing protein n=1 Tax=Solimonas soli TaxID=413479 RepID=UPI00048A41A0|nr:DUF4845 domain-containing protein [Solimonas soli]